MGLGGYFKELLHMIVEALQVQNLQSGLAGRRLMEESQSKSKGNLLAELLLTQGRSVFVLFMHSITWMKPTHIMEGNLL